MWWARREESTIGEYTTTKEISSDSKDVKYYRCECKKGFKRRRRRWGDQRVFFSTKINPNVELVDGSWIKSRFSKLNLNQCTIPWQITKRWWARYKIGSQRLSFIRPVPEEKLNINFPVLGSQSGLFNYAMHHGKGKGKILVILRRLFVVALAECKDAVVRSPPV